MIDWLVALITLVCIYLFIGWLTEATRYRPWKGQEREPHRVRNIFIWGWVLVQNLWVSFNGQRKTWRW